jgi:hypothetical protein
MTSPHPAPQLRPECVPCQAWRKPAGCGWLAAGTPCRNSRRAAQAELPTLKAQVDGGEQLELLPDSE